MKPDTTTAYATIELLASTWPKCFSAPLTGRRPLKVGIGKEIAAVAEGTSTPGELDAALRLYTTQKGYLRTLKEGALRVDLDGNPAGTVTAAQAANARRHIERIEARHSARTRVRGLAIQEAALKAEAEAAKRAAEVAAGKRRPLLRLSRQVAPLAAQARVGSGS